MTPAQRVDHIHAARVYLSEARRRRRQTFGFTLLEWAARARSRAMAVPVQPDQLEMF